MEFIIYNTPGPHGYIPKDIDRRWSLSTPLERELQPFQIQEFEPVSDYIRKIFKAYRELKVKALTFLQDKSKQRAELANRFRRNKTVRAGDRVLLKDPRQQRAGGRTPWKQPLTDPVTVKEVHGNKATVRLACLLYTSPSPRD